MLDSYRRVLSLPGALSFSATGVVARLPISMMTLGIVLLVSTLSGSYALAGQVSAAYIIGNAVVAVPHGRLADRWGQRPVLYADAVVFALATGMLVQAVTHDWPTPWPHLWAALAGVSLPQIGSLVRARWAYLLSDARQRHTAFSIESVADEIVFVTGPTLVTFLATVFAPQAGLVIAALMGTVGTVALALQRRTEPPATPRNDEAATTALRWRVLLPLTVAGVMLGGLFGALEVATVAASEDAGHKAVSGLLLAVFSFGSLLAGVITGALHWKASLLRRYRYGMTALAAAMLALPFLGSLAVLAAVLFVVGLALAPTLIAGFSLLEVTSPRGRLTESMAFLQTGISAGIAPGAWLAGVVADRDGGSAAFWVCFGSAALGALCSLAARD